MQLHRKYCYKVSGSICPQLQGMGHKQHQQQLLLNEQQHQQQLQEKQ
jgi:hypothetical protein